MATALEDRKYVADFLRVMPSAEYSIDSGNIRANGADVKLDGTPVPVVYNSGADAWDVVTTADLDASGVSGAGGFLVSGRKETITDGNESAQPHAILARGPAVVSKEAFATTDAAGGTYVVAEITSALGQLNPPVVVRDMSTSLKAQRFDG